jgi:Na+/H+ antiporter NhaD/arsenite permease-like protein
MSWNSVGPLLVFIACYVLFVLLPRKRSIVACAGALALGLRSCVGWHEIFFEQINWNVVGLFFGTLVLAEMFMQSRMPGVLAERLIDRCHTMRGAMLVVCALSGFLSIFFENVAVVLLISPVVLSLCEKLKVSPVQLLIGVAGHNLVL